MSPAENPTPTASRPSGDRELVALRMIEADGCFGPAAPLGLEDTGVDEEMLLDLALKMAVMVPQFTTDWAMERLGLPRQIVIDLMDQLVEQKNIEVRGQEGLMNYRYAVTNQGMQRGDRLLQISAYVGPAPVSIEQYTQMLEWHLDRFPDVQETDLEAAIDALVLPADAAHIAGLAVSSGRSLFVYGPPGNGKTSLGRCLHNALQGDLWVPYCLAVGHHVIRIFDPQCHETINDDWPAATAARLDQRWIHIRRPFIVVGGELTLEALDLAHSYSRGFYQAPLHVKANGGVFLLDDFGCQRVQPHELVNRWIVPLEHQVDYLTLQTGQQVQIPVRQFLIISTNLDPEDVTTPGLLRRIGYRLCLDDPTPERYVEILTRCCTGSGLTASSDLVTWLMNRYEQEKRPLRCCEPRDLINRVLDICRYRKDPPRLDTELLELAWRGYFSDRCA